MAANFPVPTWLVGCGNMAGAMVDGWRSANLDLSNTVVIRPSGLPVAGVRTVTRLADAGAPPRMILLGVKPQMLDEVAGQLASWVTSKTVIVSILAGVEAASLKSRFPRATIVRAMPNLPVSVRRGVVALYSEDADESVRKQMSDLFAVLGLAMWTDSESKFGAIGAMASAGPAYVARFIDSLAKAGAERGLPSELASTLALETVLGTAWMAAANRESMPDVARRVASPNGTTEAGLKILDDDSALDRLVAATIDAAANRSAELAREAKGAELAEERHVP